MSSLLVSRIDAKTQVLKEKIAASFPSKIAKFLICHKPQQTAKKAGHPKR